MKELALRSLHKYDQLLMTTNLSVQATKKERVIDSARAFLSSVLGKEAADRYPIRIDSKDSDRDLTPWKTCKVSKLYKNVITSPYPHPVFPL